MNTTYCIHVPLKVSLSITPIRIGKMHQLFLSGNNFVTERHAKRTMCPITNWEICKPWIQTQPVVTKMSICYRKNSYFQVKTHFSTIFPSIHLKGHLENVKRKRYLHYFCTYFFQKNCPYYFG